MSDTPILTADQTRAAEQVIFDSGVPVIDLMEKAGAAVADAVIEHIKPLPLRGGPRGGGTQQEQRHLDSLPPNPPPKGGGLECLILCGPGNNGGDGYVVARLLKEAGWPICVASLAEPKTEAAQIARDRWNGPVEELADVAPASILIDALFGTGLTRGLDAEVAGRFVTLADTAQQTIAIDLPSGIETDSGALLSPVPHFDLTIALGVLKPAHVTEPGKAHCGQVVLGDIGLIPVAREILHS